MVTIKCMSNHSMPLPIQVYYLCAQDTVIEMQNALTLSVIASLVETSAGVATKIF